MGQVKYATVDILENLTEKAEKADKNRYPLIDLVKKDLIKLGYDLDQVKLPITFTMDHNGMEVRAMFVIPGPDPEQNERFYLDMEYEDYNNLPSVELPDNIEADEL